MRDDEGGVCLVMIVKDEAHCIAKCLDSVKGLIDRYVIVDTGSTDGTQEIVRKAMKGTPGTLLERPWVNFAHNRNLALQFARDTSTGGEYAFTLDADEYVQRDGEGGWAPSENDLDGYYVNVVYDHLRYQRLAMVRLDQPWTWVGVVHEALDLPDANLGSLAGASIMVEHVGARSRDPQTYYKDAQLLSNDLIENGENPRSRFYLAQSWRDAGEYEHALTNYLIRADDESGWDQERWYAAYQVGLMKERLGHDPREVLAALRKAIDLDPSRAEPYVESARILRQQGRYLPAVAIAHSAISVPIPRTDALFLDQDAYDCRRYDEYAVSAFWAGKETAQKAISARPEDERLRINGNYYGLV